MAISCDSSSVVHSATVIRSPVRVRSNIDWTFDVLVMIPMLNTKLLPRCFQRLQLRKQSMFVGQLKVKFETPTKLVIDTETNVLIQVVA